MGVRRPDGGSASGVSRKMTPKMQASINSGQKTGMETPMFAPTIVPTSSADLWRRAPGTPGGTPTTMANNMALKPGSMVVGMRSTSSSLTGRRKRKESPGSPWETLRR